MGVPAGREGCRAARDVLESSRNLFIVHHWDADGIASAALLLRRYKGRILGVAVPRIGSYSADAIPHPPTGAGAVVVVDYGVDGREYDRYAGRLSIPVAVVDHHRASPPTLTAGYCNPAVWGEDYPSASMLVYDLLGEPRGRAERFLAALGAAGDLAPFIDAGRQARGLERAGELAQEAGVELRELRRLAEMLDSCYRLLDTSCIAEAVNRAAEDPFALAGWPRLLQAYEKASKLVVEALERVRPAAAYGLARVYRLEMDAYLTSAVGRRLASREPERVVVLVHWMPGEGRGFIYARSVAHRLDAVARRLRASGVKVGGKEHVLVLEYGSPAEGEKLLAKLVEELRRLDGGGGAFQGGGSL